MGTKIVNAFAATMLLIGCSFGKAEAGADPTSPPTTSPGDTQYGSAIELARALDASGFPCDPKPTGSGPKSTWAECTVPAYANRKPLHFTVFNSPALAAVGIKAAMDYNQTLADITGKPLYLVTGTNWDIDADGDGTAANQIASTFGGQLRSTI